MTGAPVCTEQGQQLIRKVLRDRFGLARTTAAALTEKDRNVNLALRLQAFQLRYIRPKAASDIASLEDASMLLGHTNNRITQQVYGRVGEIVKPTR